jgi:uncharacterized RmlC-like cupin family protein
MSDLERDGKPDWKTNGLRIIRSGQLDTNTPQTPGMTRSEAISHAKVGAQSFGRALWWCSRTPRLGRIITEKSRP